jgi:NTP pyrophosphatase (non-canonical NTP hydrolase)
MVAKRDATASTPTEVPGSTEPGPNDEQVSEQPLSNWEFVDRVPTSEEVRALVATLPPVWGVKTVDFIDFVQPLPSKKKTKVPHPTNDAVKIDVYHDVYTLYMSVAGRQKMCNEAAEKNGWAVDFEPEPVTPSGIPGLLSDGSPSAVMPGRILYREYVVIRAADDGRLGLGRKPGMAWVPYSGGSNAAGSNPFEKVETSARGRALGAWGFGVLPGSGIASLEEMQGVRQNQAAMETGGPPQQDRQPRKSKQELVSELLEVSEQVRQARGYTPEEQKDRLGKYLVKQVGAAGAWDESLLPDEQEIVWDRVKDGQLVLAGNAMRDILAEIRRAAGSNGGGE